ncbi:MAG TPA: cytochrome c [Caulobacterales bacterium]|nr:cytochrome c [Caulobacterales bacterium]
MSKGVSLILAAVLLSACVEAQQPPSPAPAPQAAASPTPQEALISDGRDIAEAECAGCHAVGTYGDSPNPDAPTFRTVLSRYHSEVLEEELIQGIRVSHPMPDFQFNPQGADALIAYLKSIQTTAPQGN